MATIDVNIGDTVLLPNGVKIEVMQSDEWGPQFAFDTTFIVLRPTPTLQCTTPMNSKHERPWARDQVIAFSVRRDYNEVRRDLMGGK